MKIKTAREAKEFIGERLYWEDVSPRYIFQRSGILTDVYRGKLDFDERFDYQGINSFSNLRTTQENGQQ